MPAFPQLRLRRLRRTESLRALVRETRLEVSDLIYPMFVVEGKGIKEPISSMPGVFRYSPDRLAAEIKEISSLKIPAVLLFGIPKDKDDAGSSALQKNGVVQLAIKAIKKTAPGLIVITDVCLCEYTSHGHCGIITNGEVDNDRTLPLLARMAISHIEAGADIVAPSDMMDGRVKTIREALDEKGFQDIPILSYA
ncbi:MAG: porphobilinogen synthase, partial [Chloroflexota bacterium]